MAAERCHRVRAGEATVRSLSAVLFIRLTHTWVQVNKHISHSGRVELGWACGMCYVTLEFIYRNEKFNLNCQPLQKQKYLSCAYFSKTLFKRCFNRIKILYMGTLSEWLVCFAFHRSVSKFRETEQTKQSFAVLLWFSSDVYSCWPFFSLSSICSKTAVADLRMPVSLSVLFNVAKPSIFCSCQRIRLDWQLVNIHLTVPALHTVTLCQWKEYFDSREIPCFKVAFNSMGIF